MPATSLRSLVRYLDKKLNEIHPYWYAMLEMFDIDIEEVTGEKIMVQYPNIYWYPQENIDIAVQCLSITKNG